MTHTPSTHEVRAAWAEFDGYVSTLSQYADGARAEFDRGLAEHAAEVREQIAQEIESVARGCEGDFEGGLFYAAEIVRGV